jgi:flagellar motor switch protein FliG
MFTYDNIIFITDIGIQKLLQEVDENDLLMALKASTEEIINKIFMNMSERRRQSIQNDLQTMPPVRLRDVQAAQGRILATAKEMIQSGTIEVVRDSVQEVFV